MFPVATRADGHQGTPGRSLATLRGPAQLLGHRRSSAQPTDPGAFCAALLSARTYALPPDVDRSIWRIALRHFAGKPVTEAEFRNLLERRAARSAGRDAGGQVAAFLLRE